MKYQQQSPTLSSTKSLIMFWACLTNNSEQLFLRSLFLYYEKDIGWLVSHQTSE